MVSALLASEPAYLGEGVWLARAQAAQTGWVLATPSSALTAGELPVSAMLLLCAADSSHLPQLENLAKLAAAGQLATLAGGEGLAMLQAGPASGLSETFTIINPHGLHARPGAMLVKVAKEFESDIRVANLDGSGEAVSAKSLMKVIGLGVKCGHRLAFRAEGADAEAALKGSVRRSPLVSARGALMKIVTITLNPALDLTTRLDAMSLGEVNLVSEANLRAAGKGINVAMVLKDLGREVGVTGWLGADNEQSFVSLFAERALDDHFVRVAGSTRINVKISEQSGRVTDLNLPGLTIEQGEVSALEQAIDELAAHAEWFVLAGSLPKGVAPITAPI